MIAGSVSINLHGLKRFAKATASDSPMMRRILAKWGARFRGAMQSRFVKYSRGGGNWPLLKRKRRIGQKDKAAILRDTGLMFAALTPAFQNKPGQLEQQRPYRFETMVGFGGPGGYTTGGKATLADIAEFHHIGAGFLPVRTVVERPAASVISSMAKDAEKELNAEARRLTGN